MLEIQSSLLGDEWLEATGGRRRWQQWSAAGDAIVVEAHDALVGDGDTVDIAGEIGGDAYAVAGVLDMDDPWSGPGVRWHVVGKPV